MRKHAAAMLAFAAVALAGCASPAPCDRGTAADPVLSLDACVPAFCPDGRLRRDIATDAPLFVARAVAMASRAPRFNDDGTVGRDPETGAPLYEDVAGGEVVRVLVALP